MKRSMPVPAMKASPRAGAAGSRKASFVARHANLFCCLLIVAACLAAYANSFGCPFIFDDTFAVVENTTIRHLWPIGPVLSPPGDGATVQGRPVLNLTFAINWAIGQEKVLSYHVLNLAIHLATALLLFGIVRRTLLRPRLVERFGPAATGVAFSAALLWTVHPLQTESVTYISQRAESLTAIFYLLTLYCVIRAAGVTMPPAAGNSRATCWYAISVLACLLGMASKEVMVSAPLVVLLYDRTFLAGSFKAAIRRRWPLYAALGCTWGLLAYLTVTSGGRGGTAGFGIPVSPWRYARTEPGAILHYLRLVFYPTNQVLDYHWPFADTLGQILPGAIVVAAMLAATIWALVRRPAAGFLGACFFLVLAPSSSFIPLFDAVFEHRMYLPLAAVAALAAAIVYRGWQWLEQRTFASRRTASAAKAVPLLATTLAAVALGYATFQRNEVYGTQLTLWQDIVSKRPDNPRGHNGMGVAKATLGRYAEAIACFERAIQLKDDYGEAENNLARVLVQVGRRQEAIPHYERTAQLNPGYAGAQKNLGLTLAAEGRTAEAIPHYERALQLRPDYPDLENTLGAALLHEGRLPDAISHLQRAVQLEPDSAEAHRNLASALDQSGRFLDAIPHYERAIQLKSDNAEIRNELGVDLIRTGRPSEAIAHFERALQLKSDYPEAQNNLGVALVRLSQPSKAIAHFERALQLKSDYTEARVNLAKARSMLPKE